MYFNDASGNPVNNGKLCSYSAGTSTPLVTYSDVGLTTANANPTRTSANGRPTTGAIYLSPGNSYKFILLTAGADNTCSTGTTLWTLDHVPATPTTAGNLDLTGTAGEAITAADVVYLSDGSGALTAGRWYRADADFTYASSTAAVIGIAPSSIASGASGTIRLAGRITNLSGLTAGELFYVSATAGGLTSTPPTNQWLVGKAESTTVLVLTQNQGGVRLPDSDGTHSYVLTTPMNATADRLVSLVVPDTAAALTQSPYATMEGRLTLTTALPITTADVTAATTLYWALYKGNRVSLYTGTQWITQSIAQLSIAVPATTNTLYDVFIDYTAGVPVLELVAWTNDTTRAVALATQDGVFVQTADADSRYVGSFRTTGVSGQTEDSFAKRYVWNYYNRKLRPMRVLATANSWTYADATNWQQAGAAATNQLDFVIGVAEDMLHAEVFAQTESDTANDVYVAGIGLDSVTASAAGLLFAPQSEAVAGYQQHATSVLDTYPAAGRHYAAWIERCTATCTVYGDNGDTSRQSGITGWIEQ